jgi:hypothetical protein
MAKQITFSSGITVTVQPPGRVKAALLARKTAPMQTRPGTTPPPVALGRALGLARLIAPYVQCIPPAGVEKADYLTLDVLKCPDDWELLARAIFANLLKS